MILPLLILINRHEQQNHRKCFERGGWREGERERDKEREIDRDRERDRDRHRQTERDGGERENSLFTGIIDKHLCFFFFSFLIQPSPQTRQ